MFKPAILLRALAPLVLFGAATPAFAHPDHGALLLSVPAAFAHGLAHPLFGLDHLAAMLAVGVWAAQLGGRARLAVPASFVVLMLVGALAALLGFTPPAIESGIAASLIVLGLASAAALRVPVSAAALLVGSFALFHGAAHGAELPNGAAPAAYIAGFALMTTLLHAAGLALARALHGRGAFALRVGSGLTAAAGCALVWL